MLWVNFLHFYQPPDQRRYIMEKVVNEAYRPLAEILLAYPNQKLTINFNGCLVDKLINENFEDVIKKFAILAKKEQVELTASAKYHPFLPLLPEKEIIRQIKINDQTLKKYFGKSYQPKGFYSPEAGFSTPLAKILKSLGFAWTIIDEISYSGNLSASQFNFTNTPGFYSGGQALSQIVGSIGDKPENTVQYDRIYETRKVPSFKIFFRERVISDGLASGQITSAEQFLQVLGEEKNKKRYLLTGTDGEAYGHHQPPLIKTFRDLCSSKALTTIQISEIEKYFPKIQKVDPLPSSWGTSEEEIQKKLYYSRWFDPENEIHKIQWQLTNLAIKIIRKSKKDKNYQKARKLLDKALYSCHFWWASAKPWWSIEMIERGAKNLFVSIEPLTDLSSTARRQAMALYSKIVFTAFDWLREEKVWDLSHLHK